MSACDVTKRYRKSALDGSRWAAPMLSNAVILPRMVAPLIKAEIPARAADVFPAHYHLGQGRIRQIVTDPDDPFCTASDFVEAGPDVAGADTGRG